MFDHKYLTPEHLEGFDNYKYMAIDTSPLSVNVMHPFWNKVVELFPKWVAPNFLTFAGFLLIVFDFILLSIYDYDYNAATTLNATEFNPETYEEKIPLCLWPVLAVCLFVAYTLDGIDGKQARRTKTSGPLGEMFDHGLDSYSVFFIPACLFSIFGRGDFSAPLIRMYYILWNILLNFYLSHWEKYNTGVLFLPWGYDFSMWASTMFFFLTGICGTVGYKVYVFSGFSVANAFEVLIVITGVCSNIPVAVYNTYLSYKNKTGKMRSASEALRPMWSLLAIFIIQSLWVHRSPRNILEYDPRAVFLLIGTLFSNVACRLIVAQMSNQRCEAFNMLTLPLLGAYIVSVAVPSVEIVSLYVLTLYVVLSHIHYGACVVRQMCDHFRIKCFKIKPITD